MGCAGIHPIQAQPTRKCNVRYEPAAGFGSTAATGGGTAAG